jgi:predicted transposase YbfD/YdcC
VPGLTDRRCDPPDLVRAEAVDKGHGRIETRIIAVRAIPSRLDQNWPGATRICRIERRRELKDRCTRQVVYAITSLPAERANAETLLKLARDHWRIENNLFHVKDVSFAEDTCRVRSDQAPAALAHIRNAALNFIRQRGLKPRPAREAFAASYKATIRAVLTA